MQQLPAALHPLSAWKQFVCWKAVPSKTRQGKFDKFPCTQNGQIIDAHDSRYWLTADEAMNRAPDLGVGFVLTSNDPFFFIDIDGAHDGTQWSTLATQLCSSFTGACVEVSHSGTGLHVIGQYAGDEPDHACKNIPLHLELYTSGRFVALTGNFATGNASQMFDLSTVISGYFPPSNDIERPLAQWSTTHVVGAYPIEDDNKLITKACDTNSMFGQSASFKALFTADADELGLFYPDHGGQARGYDASSADAALAQHLGWWTGGNCERIERLMRSSALARSKWDNHKSYLTRTILNAVSRTSSYYDKGKPAEIVAQPIDNTVSIKPQNQFIPTDQQMEVFEGCVYVCDIHRVFTPRGTLMKKEQFNAMYGGYRFSVDHENEKTTTNAWDAFVESQVLQWPKVESSCFRPDLAPGQIIEREGVRQVNVYVPLDIEVTHGADVTPFMNHLRKLLPDERDQTILLSYMAACVQYKGYKIQWAPLIQGVEGNGKTLLTRCLKYAIGEKYSHMPNASKIDSEFNGWLLNKLFIGVEDIYVPEHRREILERLKPMITGGDGLEIQLKGVDQVTRDICANFMLNSNHKDAIKKTLNDRRYCVFYTAQQEASDIVRDGLTGEYFRTLYEWLRGGGYAAVAGMLHDYAIPDEFNATGRCQRAPDTSSTLEAVSYSVGSVEQEVLEAIDEGRTGFAGGWVSSLALDSLIRDLRKDHMVPRNKRRDLMKSLGYDYHPALRDGRVNSCLNVDAMKKPRLYVKAGHLALNLTKPADVAQQYCHDQGDPLSQKIINADVRSI